MRFLILLLSLFFTSSCATTKSKSNEISLEKLTIDQKTKDAVRGAGAFALLEHQLIPIDYLHRNEDIKGLLVNHYMGTGKTFLGIGLAQSYPDRPVLIVAPKFLQSHWTNEINAYGVTNPKRFTFVSFDDAPDKLSDIDLSKHVLLVDEAHNLIRRMRSLDPEVNARYTQVYQNLRKSYKIFGLTGTPIYNDESDLAFIINFVSGEDLMPFNQEAFRLEYSKILPMRQYFRGYLTESNLFINTFPLALGLYSMAIFGPIGLAVGFPIGIFAPVIINLSLNPNTFKIRKLDIEKMRPFMNKYVSYFRFSDSHFKDFPAQDMQVVEVPYSRQQFSFFLRLVEGDLPVPQLQRLLKNEPIGRSDEFVAINSTNIHQNIYSTIGAGRDIGNYEFSDQDGSVIEAPKFMRIYQELKANNEQSVIYSNYYHTGILAFKDFLLRQGYEEKFAIIEPNMSMNEVSKIVSDYNSGTIRLLLLHPDITEGISLKGTQYLHILEPMLNSTVLEQVVGRTRRFQSHSHLPKEKQMVHVRMWLSTSSTWNPDLTDINRANWYKRYRELNYFSRWGLGIAQIDKNLDRKILNPEELALLKLRTIEKNFAEMQTLLTNVSIENRYHAGVAKK